MTGFQDENATSANAIHPFPAVIPLFQKFVFASETHAPLIDIIMHPKMI